MNVEMFAQQVQEIHWRLAELYRGASGSVKPQDEMLLPTAFKELGTASEELQVAAEELSQQTEELVTTRSQLEAERHRYRDLFEFLPNACLVTDAAGKIQEANRAAAALLNIEPPNLVGKVVVNFIPLEERRGFRSKLNQLLESNWVQEWNISMEPRQRELFDAAVTVAPVRDSKGELVSLRWIVRDITERKRSLKLLTSHESDALCQNRPKRSYCKGEIIPLEPQSIWLVSQGLVKLNTMGESGEEVLIGFVGPSMPFGSSLTALHTYQATALSEKVDLVSISLAEIAASPRLTQELLPKISDRLRQTEFLLAISGKRQVKDRLYYLLQWLKQQFGQSVSGGTRLSVRLTHQDLADACCTTRVTVTRLLGKLQKEGKIAFDSKNYLCFIDERYEKCS